MKKNIWILNHHAETPKTGTGTRHYDFAKELIKRDYSVTVFASSHIHYTDINILEPNEDYRIVDEDGITWVWIKTKIYTSNGLNRILSMIEYYFKVQKLAKKLANPDAVIGSSVHLLACLAGIRISRRNKINSITEIRDLWPETLIQMGRLKRNSLVSKGLFALEKYIYKKTDSIIVTAPGMVDYIASKGIDKNKITYINNGLNTELFDQRKNMNFDEDKNCKLPDQSFNVVYTGGHGLANDLFTAVEAAKLIKEKGYENISFFFFGEGPLRQDAIALAQKYGLHNMDFRGLVPKYCIPKILCNSDLLLVMIKNLELYNTGVSMNKYFEYLYAGTPIVATMNIPNDYIKETGCGISCPPEDPEALAEGIIKLYNMTQVKRKEIGCKGKEFVKKNFDISVLVDKLEIVINL